MINENKDYIMIDFTGIFKTLLSKFWMILLAGIICAVIAGGYARIIEQNKIYVPMYMSTAKIYVTGSYSAFPSVSSKTNGQSFMEDFFELMKSRKVIDEVIEDLGLNMTNIELIDCIYKSSISETCMFYLTVVFPDAELSKSIVDELLKVTSAYAIEIMGMTPPKVYEEAQVPQTAMYTNNTNVLQYGLYGLLGGSVFAVIVILFFCLIDNRIYTPRQVSQRMMLPVLTAVINFKNTKGNMYNKIAMQYLYGFLYTIKKDSKFITFLSAKVEDKVNLIYHYANFLKQMGKKVLILDTRLSLATGKNGNGLKEYLLDCAEDVESIIFSKDGIDIIDCDESIPNAVELLSSSTFDKLVSVLREMYDYVLVNTTPTEYAADALAVYRHSDINIIVVEVGKTKLISIESLMDQYNKNSEITGVVMTNVKLKKRSIDFKKEFGKYLGII